MIWKPHTPRVGAAAVIGLLALGTAAAAPAGAQDVAIVDVRLFDGEVVRDGVTVLVRGGMITAVGSDLSVPADIEVVDGTGRTLLPGLIDAHTHALTEGDLEAALRFGVTTELDHFGDPAFLRRMRTEQQAGEAAARADLFGAGIVATAPGGHGTQYEMDIPTLTEPAEAETFVSARVAEGSDWLKIIRSNPEGSRPTLDPRVIRALIEAAHEQGMIAVVHISTVDDALAVVEMGADGIVHTADDRMPEPDFGERFAATGAFVVPTLTVLWAAFTGEEGPAQIDDPLLGPRLDARQKASLTDDFSRRENPAARVAASSETVRLLDGAGVQVLAGSDAPNPHTAHGASLHRELQNLVSAGLSPIRALIAATSAPADAFGLDDRGRVSPGLRADLILVEGDPTTDIRASRAILGVWKGGVRAEDTPPLDEDRVWRATALLGVPEPVVAQTRTDSLGVIDVAMTEWFEIAENYNPHGTPTAFCFRDHEGRLGFRPGAEEGESVVLPEHLRFYLFGIISANGLGYAESCTMVGEEVRNMGLMTSDGRPAVQMTVSGLYFVSPDRAYFTVGYYSAPRAGYGRQCPYDRVEGGWKRADLGECIIWHN